MNAFHSKLQKVELNQEFWTTTPTIYETNCMQKESVPAWKGYVVKVIGQSAWLRRLEHEDLEPDPSGTWTAIVHLSQLFETEGECLA